MKTLGLGYRDRDPRSTKKFFVERLAAQAITRVRRRLLPKLRLKTPQEQDQNGKKKRRRGNAKTVEYDEVTHVKTVPAPSTPNRKVDIEASKKSYMSAMETVLVTNESSTCSPMTDSMGGSMLPNLRELFSEYFERGGKLDNWSSMEDMIKNYENSNKKKKKVTAEIFEIDCEDLIPKKDGEDRLFHEVGSGLGVMKINHEDVTNNDTCERLKDVQEKDEAVIEEGVDRENEDKKETDNGKNSETTKGNHSIINNDNGRGKSGEEKVDVEEDGSRKSDFKYCEECKDISTLKMESERNNRWLKETYGGLVCVGNECGRKMSEVVKTDNYAWVCNNCRGEDRTCERMMCNGCWEKERGDRRGRGTNRMRGERESRSSKTSG